MKKLTPALLFIALCSTTLVAQTKNSPVFKKETVERKTTPAQTRTLGVTVEKYVKNYEVNADGTAIETWEMQQRFDSDLTIDRFRKFERSYNSDLQRAEVLDAYIVKPDGAKLALAPKAVQIKPTAQAEAAPGFSSYKQIQIAYDALEKGDAIYFKIRIHRLKPDFEKQFDFVEVFPLGYAWKWVEINLTAPAGYPLYTQAVDLQGGKLADENGKARWQWRAVNLKPFEIEPGMYDFFNSSPRVAATSFKNYEELGTAYWSEAKKKAIVTPEVQKLADEITKDINEPARQAFAIYEWVNKNIRYLSIVLDKGGWIPHSTAEILANRYADCKDYTTILHALLKAKSIESHPVLIRSELGNWFPEVAAPDYFNHAILYIPGLNLFADATAPNTRLGLLAQQNVGKKAALAGERTGVVEMPRDNPADNQLLSDVEISFAPDGSLKAVSKNVYEGRSEIIYRPLFADASVKKFSGNFVRTMLSYFGVEGSGKVVKMGSPFKTSEPLAVETEVEMPDFTVFQPRGALTLPVAVNLLNSLELEQFVKTARRSTNLILGATRFAENFKLNFPEGVKIEKLPGIINFSNAVGSYRLEFSFENGGVKVTRELVIGKDVISPKDYPLIRALIKKSVEGAKAEIQYSAPVNPSQINNSSTRQKNQIQETNETPVNDMVAAQLEAQIQAAPDDSETRRRLLRFYTNYRIEDTPARQLGRVKHRLWFLQNQPEIEDADIYGYQIPFYSVGDAEYKILREEWLKQVEKNAANSRIRLNAVSFFRSKEPEIAEKLLAEGCRIDPENYEFPLQLSELIYAKIKDLDEDSDEYLKKKSRVLGQTFEAGERALTLLKTERSNDRDAKRAGLLQSLTKIAFELGKFDRAKMLATELILDFGQDAANTNYADATHIGNIILGRIAVRENDAERAKQYLLIAVRAPLRREKSYFSKIDLRLARELLEKGEKATVAEYLKLCERLLNYSDLYAGKLRALKSWQEQISQGKMPSFDFARL